MKKNILIIIRGPSCSGKTTLAKKLFSSSNNKTAIIQQDHYREIFNPPGGGSKHNGEVIPLMIEHNTKVALENGYNVILEGVFNVEMYQPVLNSIIGEHLGESYLFYLNVSLKETIERGKTKSVSGPFNAAKLKEWYPDARRPYHKLESLIPEKFSIDDSFNFIVDAVGRPLWQLT